jgi:hypothetical protein
VADHSKPTGDQRWPDDDDWVGEPPEGRYGRERAKPEYWRGVRLVSVAGAVAGIALLVLLIVLLS